MSDITLNAHQETGTTIKPPDIVLTRARVQQRKQQQQQRSHTTLLFIRSQELH